MINALETAAQMMKLGIDGYFLAGLQGILIGLVFGVELIIILEILTNGKNSRILNFIKKLQKQNGV